MITRPATVVCGPSRAGYPIFAIANTAGRPPCRAADRPPARPATERPCGISRPRPPAPRARSADPIERSRRRTTCPRRVPEWSTSHTTRCPGCSPPARPDPATVELRMPFRIETPPSDQLRIVSWRFLVQVDGEPWTVPSSARRITREVVDLLRRQMRDRGQFQFDRVPPYLDMADRMEPGVQYLEGTVPGVPRGARVEYRLEVTLRRDQQPAVHDQLAVLHDLRDLPGVRPGRHRAHPHPGARPGAAGLGAVPAPRAGFRARPAGRGVAGGRPGSPGSTGRTSPTWCSCWAGG